jgi:hypothetical protein
MDALDAIEQKVLAVGEIVGIAWANDEEIDLYALTFELHKIYSMIGEMKNAKDRDILER